MRDHIPASIEISPKFAVNSQLLGDAFPRGTRVYISDTGSDPTDYLVAAARRITALGYVPVPHFAARRIISASVLEERIARMSAEAGVRDVLVIGGGLDRPVGAFESSMALLETGLFEKHGITHMGVAGHPEGSPDFDARAAIQALRDKQNFAADTGIKVRIVTQFGFDGEGFAIWALGLARQGITLPVHLGVAGPAKIPSLIKYAAMCGVGPSLTFLKKRFSALTTLAVGFDPELVARPIEQAWQDASNGAISQIHVFPFGGVHKSAKWLYERRSWAACPDALSDHLHS